jgi:DNA mismatch endonuclease, patch repair protein
MGMSRSTLMAKVRRKNTEPELAVRRLLFALGFRYRLHCPDLPGTPDIVLRRLKKVIFVHGCFWHRHPGCRFASMPASRQDFWSAKFESNVRRDRQKQKELQVNGWSVLIVWGCETRETSRLVRKLERFFSK